MSIKTRPHRVLFMAALAIGAITALLWRLDRKFGRSYTEQSDFEQSVRLFFGMLSTTIPLLLIFGLGYWILYKMKRPTNEQLNVYHLLSILGLIITNFIYGMSMLVFDSGRNTNGIIEYLITIITITCFGLFIANIIKAFIKPRDLNINQE